MSTILCPNCEHANSPDSKFCSNCGHRLPPSREIICPNCQTPNPRNLFYCDHCGARLVKENLPTEVESDPDLDDELEQPFVHPTGLFALPTRKPGETGKLDRNTLPDWLRTGGQEEDEDEAADEALPESPEVEEASSLRNPTDELPDWLVTDSSVELYQPPSEISTEAFLQMTQDEPPELTDSTGITDDLNFPDWLTDAVRDTDALTKKKPAPLPEDEATELPNPFETSTNIPEWLAEVGGITKTTPTSDEAEEVEEEIPTVEEWGFSESDYDDTPDWLMDSGTETAESAVEQEAPVDVNELQNWGTAVASSARLPDWHNELARPNSEKLHNWLLELEDLEEPDFLIDEPEGTLVTGRLTDWLSDSDDSTTSDDDEGLVTGMLTGWLSELDEAEEESEEGVVTGMLTGWLTELDSEDESGYDEASLVEEPESDQFTDWLSGAAEAEDADFLTEEPQTGQFTGWLAGQDETDEPDFLDEVEEDEESESDQFTDWLSGAAESEDADSLTEEPQTGQFTGWLTGQDETDEPDFLDEVEEDEESESDQFTGWLSDAAEAEDADFLIEEPQTGQLTGWLASEDKSDKLDLEEDEGESEEKDTTGLLTGWLAELDKEAEADSLDDEVEEEPEKKVVTGMLTGWLAELGDEEEEEEEEEVVTGMLTGWLAELDEEAEADFPDDETAVPDQLTNWLSDTPSQINGDIAADGEDTDWLTEMQTDGLEETDEEAASLDHLSDWLESDTDGLFEEDVFERDAFEETADEAYRIDELETGAPAVSDTFASEDDWLFELDPLDDEEFDEAAEIASLPEPTLPEEPERSQEPPLTVHPEEPTTGSPLDEEESDVVPDWLTDLRQAEGQAIEHQSDLVQEDLPQWLSNMKPSGDTDGSSMPGLDLDVDLVDDFAEIPPELSGADLPDWLHIPTSSKQGEGDSAAIEYGSDVLDWLQPGEGEQIQKQDPSGQLRSILSELPPPRDPREGLVKADIPEWVDALKPKSLTGGQQPESRMPAPESGPLRGVPGVIEIAPIMATSHMAHEAPHSQLTITPEQQQQAELLQQLAQGEMLLSATAVAPRRRLAWGRVLLSLIFLAIMSAAIILDTPLSLVRENPMPAPASVEKAQTAITAATGQPVLVAFDYTPALEGELGVEAAALMAQLAANGSPVIPVSQSAAGTAIAATYTDAPTLFIPGEAIGLRQMGICLADRCNLLFGRALEADLSQAGLIVVLTGERKNLVNWVEQVGSQTNTPLLAATTQSLEPVALTYVTSGQLDGTLSHLAASGRYEDTLPVAAADAAGQRVLNAQLLMQLLLVVVLLIGLIGQLGRTAMSRNR